MTKNTPEARKERKEKWEALRKMQKEIRDRADANYTSLCQTLKDWNYDEEEIGEGIKLLGAYCSEAGGIEIDEVMADITSIEMEELVMRANHIGGYADEGTRNEAVRRLFNRGFNVVYDPLKYNRATNLQTGETVSAPFAECLEAVWAWAMYELRDASPDFYFPENVCFKQTETPGGSLWFEVGGLEYAIQFSPVSEG